ncbi:MAG: hypothetical protein K1W18_07045 [Oscillospiraceae bacterium]
MNRCSDCVFCRVIATYTFGDSCSCDISGYLIEDEHTYACRDFISNENALKMKEDYYTLLKRKRDEHKERGRR